MLGAGHRLYDISSERRVQIAEEAHRFAIFAQRHQHLRSGGFGYAFRLDGIAIFINRLKIFAIENDIRALFACQNRVRLRSRGD